MPRPPKVEGCWSCGRPATRLCDYILASPIVGYNQMRRPFTSSEVDPPTCDRPLCETHAYWPQGMFLCGEDVDTLDYCAAHLAAYERDDYIPLLSEEAIAALRQRLAQERPKHNIRILQPRLRR